MNEVQKFVFWYFSFKSFLRKCIHTYFSHIFGNLFQKPVRKSLMNLFENPLRVNRTCTKHEPSVHRACTELVLSVHGVGKERPRSVHVVCKEGARSVRVVCKEHARSGHIPKLLVGFLWGKSWQRSRSRRGISTLVLTILCTDRVCIKFTVWNSSQYYIDKVQCIIKQFALSCLNFK